MQRVHQIILNDQDDKELSPFVEMSVETIRSKISGSYRLWGREELEELMRNEYGQEVVSAYSFRIKTNMGKKSFPHSEKCDLTHINLTWGVMFCSTNSVGGISI